MNQASIIDETTFHGVITGDLVASSAEGALASDRAMAVLGRAASEIDHWPISDGKALGETHFTRHRGDGWQIHLAEGAFALRAAIFLFAKLAAHPDLPQTRLALGLGPIDRLSGPDLSGAHGAAFTTSGRALGDMARGERMRLRGSGITPVMEATAALLDEKIQGWSPEQAEAIAHVIAPDAPTQTRIARKLGISPQALSARLASAGWSSLKQFLKAWEADHG